MDNSTTGFDEVGSLRAQLITVQLLVVGMIAFLFTIPMIALCFALMIFPSSVALGVNMIKYYEE